MLPSVRDAPGCWGSTHLSGPCGSHLSCCCPLQQRRKTEKERRVAATRMVVFISSNGSSLLWLYFDYMGNLKRPCGCFRSEVKASRDPVPAQTDPDRCAQWAGRMGRREADSRGAMNISQRSELGCLQDSASSGHHGGENLQRMDKRRGRADMGASTATAAPLEVKKHQHKHNLKHRYEVMETLGKGTYGKVKKAVERTSLRTVSRVTMETMMLSSLTANMEWIKYFFGGVGGSGFVTENYWTFKLLGPH